MNYSRPIDDVAQKKKNCSENDIGIAGAHVVKTRKKRLSCAIRARRQGYFRQKEIFKKNKIGIISQILLVLSKKGIGKIIF